MARFGTFWSAGTLVLLRWCVGLDHEVRGRENLPDGPVIIAMKHQSAWDTLAAPVIFARPAIVIKRELGFVPFYGWYALKAGMIPIDRGAGATALRRMIAAAERAKAAGRPIFIFPEGTRTAVGERRPYQPGVAALYRQLGMPLVPVAVNSGLFWGRRRFLKRPGRIVVEILPPMLTSFREQHPGLEALYFITGADAILEILTWRRYKELTNACEFIAATRPGADLSRLEEMLDPDFLARTHFLQIPGLDISSSELRRRVREGRTIKYQTPEGVDRYASGTVELAQTPLVFVKYQVLWFASPVNATC